MQIINKPKQYKLPFRIHKRLITSQSQIKLPQITNIYIPSKQLRKKSVNTKKNKDNFVSYVAGKDIQIYRPIIREALAKNINFQPNQGGRSKFLPQEVIHKLKQPIKAVLYNTEKFKFLFKIITDIFGKDFDIASKDVIAADGTLSHSTYVFFTAAYYQPFSLCCKSIVYLKMINNKANEISNYSKSQIDLHSNSENSKITNGFICSKCEQNVLTIQCKSQGFIQQSKVLHREKSQIDIQRHKISLSIMVLSGKYKKVRMDSISQHDISASKITSHNPEQQYLRKKSQTFILNPLNKGRNLQSDLR